MRPLKKSVCADDVDLVEERKKYVRDPIARKLACKLRHNTHKRTLHFYEPVITLILCIFLDMELMTLIIVAKL